MNIRAARQAVVSKLKGVADSKVEGDTKPIKNVLEEHLNAVAQRNAGSTPHVRGDNDSQYTVDPMVLRTTVLVEGSVPLVRKAVAQLELELIKQGAKVETELQKNFEKVWVTLVVDMNDVRT